MAVTTGRWGEPANKLRCGSALDGREATWVPSRRLEEATKLGLGGKVNVMGAGWRFGTVLDGDERPHQWVAVAERRRLV